MHRDRQLANILKPDKLVAVGDVQRYREYFKLFLIPRVNILSIRFNYGKSMVSVAKAII